MRNYVAEDKILQLLAQCEDGCTITQIVTYLNSYHSAVLIYLAMLERDDKIRILDIGRAKLVKLKKPNIEQKEVDVNGQK